LLAGIPRDHGSDTVIDEIDVVDPPVMRLQLLADWKIDGLQVRFQQTEIRRREARERWFTISPRMKFSQHRLFPWPEGLSTAAAL